MRLERKVVLISSLVLAVLAIAIVPVFAAKPPVAKTVGMTVTPNSVTAGGSQAYTVTLTNTTPGNSNPNSFRIFAPAGWNVTGASYLSGTNPNAGRLVTPNTSTDTVAVTGLDPLKSTGGQNVKISVTATAPSATGCGSTSGVWNVTGYTGTGLSGDTFSRNTPDSDVTTTANADCTLSIDPISGAIINQDFTVTVRVGSGGSTADFDGNVTLAVSSKPTPGAGVDGTGTHQATDGVASFTLNADTLGEYELTATATGLTEEAIARFEVFNEGIFCGGQSFPPSQGGGTTSQLFRTDGGPPDSPCIDVPYTLTSVDDHTVILLKDQAVVDQQGAEFKLVITWGLSAGEYPNFGTTTFDLDGNFQSTGDKFVPDNCAVVGGLPQVPVNPDGGGLHWPDGTAEKPWCHAGTSIVPSGTGYQVTETFLGAGDPNIVRNK